MEILNVGMDKLVYGGLVIVGCLILVKFLIDRKNRDEDYDRLDDM